MTMTSTDLAAPVQTAPTAPTSPATPDLPLAFESALQKMLQTFGADGDPSLSAIAGGALLLLQKAEQSLATIAGTAGDEAKNGLVVKLPLDPEVQGELVSGLNAMKVAIAAKERDVAGLKEQLKAVEVANQASQANAVDRMTQLDEDLADLRARHGELSETVQKLEAAVEDHSKFAEQHTVLIRRIELLETPRKR